MIKRASSRLLTVVSLLLVSGMAAAQPVELSDEEIVRRTQAVIDWALESPGTVALSVAVAKDGNVLVEQGVGIADVEFGVPANAGTTFRIGSVTKQFTAAAIMKLAEQDLLSIDDDISDYLPDFDAGGRDITIRQLLNHTSGVPSYTSQPEFFPRGSALNLTHEELLAYIDGVPFDFEPGEGWNYSNSGYYLLGMIIEAASGETYADYIENTFSEPLGLTRTRYGSESEIIQNRAQGYNYDTVTKTLTNDELISMNTPGAAGALIASAGDLVRWQVALTGGQAVSPDSYEQMITSTVETGQGPQEYGFGLMINEINGRQVISHTGGIPGFNSILTTVPDQDLHVAVISNSNGMPSNQVSDLIFTALMSAEAPPLPELRDGPDPRSSEAVRRLIEGIASGELDYDLIGPQLAEAIRSQMPATQPMIRGLGAIESIDFQANGPAGGDIYEIRLENGGLMMQIILDAEGRTVSAGLRPLPPAQ